jgi:hypothetical protein
MFSDSCKTATFLETFTSELLELESNSPVWKVRETSITDAIIATFKSHGKSFFVEVDASYEPVTNADFEVIFNFFGKEIAFLFQAKRCSTTPSGKIVVPELFHLHASGTQNDDLIAYGNSNSVLTYYAFYISKTDTTDLSVSRGRPISGIMLQDAQKVRNIGFKKPKNNIRILDTHLTNAIRFSELFCAFEKSVDIGSFLRLLSLPDTVLPLVTSEMSLQSRRERDDEHFVFARLLLRK